MRKKVQMKTVLVTAITILVAAGANAQPGMPKTLTCTEEAFNFSVSLGTKWKFSTPKMGPVEAAGYETDYNPAWSFKLNQAAPETDLLPLFQAQSKAIGLSYAIGQPGHGPLFYPNRFSAKDRPKYAWPIINFGPSINYMMYPPLMLSTGCQ
jgi:hypothetical protein